MRKYPFRNGEYYHIYNRGIDKRNIFNCQFDYMRFLESLREFNRINPVGSLYMQKNIKKSSVAVGQLQKKKLVDIISFNLLPNHFHLILKQKSDGGISEFMKRMGGGYTQFYNYKYKRSGFLFQGKFKSIHIDSNGYLLYLSAYVNGNRKVHKLFMGGSCCSLDYISSDLINLEVILNDFKNINEYKKYVESVSMEVRTKREEMKKYILE